MENFIQVLEHERLVLGGSGARDLFQRRHLANLQEFWERDSRYFDLIHEDIRLKHYVGVLRVDDLTIEILPKVDQQAGEKQRWQRVLLHMLRESGLLQVATPTTAPLSEMSGSVLEAYYALFLDEIEDLLQRGLIRQYRRTEGQQRALRGALHLSKHLSRNGARPEQFYTRHQSYDKEHLVHDLLGQALQVLTTLSLPNSSARTHRALLAWPTITGKRMQPTPALFGRLRRLRRLAPYSAAIRIARMILLNFHPALQSGSESMLALLFNMNQLWEQYLLHTLQRHLPADRYQVLSPATKVFWQDGNTQSRLRPDILVIYKAGSSAAPKRLLIDAKWKLPTAGRPAEADLRQLFVYSLYYQSNGNLLAFPASNETRASVSWGNFSSTLTTPSVVSGGLAYACLSETATGDLVCSLVKQVKAWCEA